MSEYPLFYNSNNNDRVYSADDFSDWTSKLFTNGVMEGECEVTAPGNMTVSVAAGSCNINGKLMIYETATALNIDAADASLPRIDAVVIERNDTDRDFYIKVVKGTYNASPSVPEPVREGNIYQIVLASVEVKAGVTVITSANITDLRADEYYCGICLAVGASVSKDVPVAVPVQSNELIYNGEEQTAIFGGYVPEAMILSGNTTATDAGIYTVSFLLKEGFCWPDKSRAVKYVPWQIEKAASSIIVSNDDVTLGDSPITVSLTVSRAGTITANSSNSDIGTAEVSGNSVVLTRAVSDYKGTAVVNVELEEAANYQAAAAQIYITKTTGTTTVVSWAKLKKDLNDGNMDAYNVGDTYSITLKGNETHDYVIVAKNHDADRQLIFSCASQLDAKRVLDTVVYIEGIGKTIADTMLYKWLDESHFYDYPTELQQVITERKIEVNVNGYNNERLDTIKQRIWFPRVYEIAGTGGPASEQGARGIKQFEYYRNTAHYPYASSSSTSPTYGDAPWTGSLTVDYARGNAMMVEVYNNAYRSGTGGSARGNNYARYVRPCFQIVGD